jgi:hypothetical protein
MQLLYDADEYPGILFFDPEDHNAQLLDVNSQRFMLFCLLSIPEPLHEARRCEPSLSLIAALVAAVEHDEGFQLICFIF